MKVTATKTATIDLACFYKCMLLGFMALSMYMLMAAPAFASATTMGDMLCGVISFIEGNLGRSIATLAVAVIGAGATLGKVSWGMAITVVCGIAVMGNCVGITQMLIGQTTICMGAWGIA